MSIFDAIRRRRGKLDGSRQKENNGEPSGSVTETRDAIDGETEAYYFEDAVEMVLYSKRMSNGNKNVVMLKGEAYINEYNRGFALFEQGRFKEAIEAYKNSLKLNPVGINARFEICESYIRLGNLSEARNTLLEMKELIVENETIAKFYRRMGFIATEERRFTVAAACYLYSLQYEKSPGAVQELMYIVSEAGQNALPKDPVSVMQREGLPVLTKPQTL